MPYTCSVPNCKGNYRSGPKVNVFKFPNHDDLSRKWLTAIRRVDYIPNKNSRVCELHFRPGEIRRETSHFDKKTGRKLVAKLTYPQLCDGVIPSQLPNCPSHLSGSSHLREAPDKKRKRMEESAIQAAVAQSKLEEQQYRETREFNSLDELKEKLQCIDKKYWTVIENEEEKIKKKKKCHDEQPHTDTAETATPIVKGKGCGHSRKVCKKCIPIAKDPLALEDVSDTSADSPIDQSPKIQPLKLKKTVVGENLVDNLVHATPSCSTTTMPEARSQESVIPDASDKSKSSLVGESTYFHLFRKLANLSQGLPNTPQMTEMEYKHIFNKLHQLETKIETLTEECLNLEKKTEELEAQNQQKQTHIEILLEDKGSAWSSTEDLTIKEESVDPLGVDSKDCFDAIAPPSVRKASEMDCTTVAHDGPPNKRLKMDEEKDRAVTGASSSLEASDTSHNIGGKSQNTGWSRLEDSGTIQNIGGKSQNTGGKKDRCQRCEGGIVEIMLSDFQEFQEQQATAINKWAEQMGHMVESVEDEFHLFGLNVASQMRQLPLEQALSFQAQIEEILGIISKFRRFQLKPRVTF